METINGKVKGCGHCIPYGNSVLITEVVTVNRVNVLVEDTSLFKLNDIVSIDVREIIERDDGYKIAVSCARKPKHEIQYCGLIINVTESYCDIRDGYLVFRIFRNTAGLYKGVFLTGKGTIRKVSEDVIEIY